MTRSERQKQTNQILHVLPTFTPINSNCYIYCINKATLPLYLHDLIHLAERTTRFTIDTEHDYYTYESALIQIEFINYDRSAIILIQTSDLPDSTSVGFFLMRKLMAIILQHSNTLYGWGDMKYELMRFIHFHLFSSHAITQINFINVQYHFKQWYNQTFLHQCGLPLFSDDHDLCTCFHRPIKNKDIGWPLQKAIACMFHEFLDKTLTRCRWSLPFSLSRTIQYYLNLKHKTTCLSFTQKRLLFAANDCFAITKLWMILELHWTQEQHRQYRLSHKK